MTGRGGGDNADAAGGPVRHRSVLLAEVLSALAPAADGTVIDGTFGAGGYTEAILANAADANVIAVDRDPTAIRDGAAVSARWPNRLRLVHGEFASLDRIAADAGCPAVDAVVLDIGVSSMQLDEAERGFSFRFDGPLDMRMAQVGPSAADLVNEAGEAELADIIYRLGEERRSRAIARAIVERRRREPFATTGQLAELVARHVRSEPGIHPATRTFQALRIAVNDELGQLRAALEAAERALKPGGRLAVVTFHSLEDRIVKAFMQERSGSAPRSSRHQPMTTAEVPTFSLVRRGPVSPGDGEVASNPRARSAKLRFAERTDAPARSAGGEPPR